MFKRVISSIEEEYEGGSNLSYRLKCNFDKPRQGSRLNKNHMQCARCVKAILVLGNFVLFIPFVAMQLYTGYNPLPVIISYYSPWGQISAFLAHIFSIIACNRDGWFRTAYIMTEIAYAINAVIMIIFWGILWPVLSKAYSGDPAAAGIMGYQAAYHFIPFLTVVSDLYMTDMALEKKHWWIAFITACPAYMVCNWWGSMTMGNAFTKKPGSIYGPEMWDSNVPLTIFLFVLMGVIQGGLLYCSAAIVDRVWPKRTHEIFEGGQEEKAIVAADSEQ